MRLARTVTRLIDYKKLSDVKIPKRKKVKIDADTMEMEQDTRLFRVNILETDTENGVVKARGPQLPKILYKIVQS